MNNMLFEWMGETKEGMKTQLNNEIGIFNNTIKFMEFTANTPVSFKENSAVKQPFYDFWNNFVNKHVQKGPKELKSLKQTAGNTWSLMASETALS